MNEEKVNSKEQSGELPDLSEESRRFLKEVAMEAVKRQAFGEMPQKLLYEDPKLRGRWGVFVTLKSRGELRGCIGNLMSDRPLPETVAEMAVKSASMDPRFPPLGPAEIDSVEVDISILGDMEEVKDINNIKIGRDGLLIEQGGRHGLLLPQVATEHNLDVPAFLSQTCLKAGLPPDAWQHGAKIYKFSAEVF
jgi:AmmeMemoRadiSam system protein A